MVSEFILGIALGIVSSIMSGIWIELFFRWWERNDPWGKENKHLGIQLIITTIITWGLLIGMIYLAFSYKPQ
jgi:O-antigen/teichoic acid export membrane protein